MGLQKKAGILFQEIFFPFDACPELYNGCAKNHIYLKMNYMWRNHLRDASAYCPFLNTALSDFDQGPFKLKQLLCCRSVHFRTLFPNFAIQIALL